LSDQHEKVDLKDGAGNTPVKWNLSKQGKSETVLEYFVGKFLFSG